MTIVAESLDAVLPPQRPSRSPTPLTRCCPSPPPKTPSRSPTPLSQCLVSPPLRDLLGRPLSDLLGCPRGVVHRHLSETFSVSYSPLLVLSVAAPQRLPISFSPLAVLSIAAAPNRDLLTLCCVFLDLLGRPLRDLFGCPLRDLLGRPLCDLLVAHVVLSVAAPQRLPIPLFQWDPSPPLTDLLTPCCASL